MTKRQMPMVFRHSLLHEDKYIKGIGRLQVATMLIVSLFSLMINMCTSFAPKKGYSRNHKLHSQKNSDDAYDLFCKMRIGLGKSEHEAGSNNVIFWAGSGTLYRAYSGEVLSHFSGVDVSKGERIDADRCRQLSRKAFWFTDPSNGSIVTHFKGEAVNPILYPAQVIEYRRDKDGAAAALPSVISSARQVPVQPITSSEVDYDKFSTVLFQAPVFVDVPVADNARYQAWEFYDYNCDPAFERPPSVVWSRQGSTMPFDKDQRAVMRFVGQRYTSLEEIPNEIASRLRNDFPLYCQPPNDMDEVNSLLG